MENEYHWARWRFCEDVLGKWEIVLIRWADNRVCIIESDVSYTKSGFEIGDKIPEPEKE